MIKRFLTQQVLGYNTDFNVTYIKSVAEMADGSIETFYCSYTWCKDDTAIWSAMVKTRPFVAKPIDVPVVNTEAASDALASIEGAGD